MAGTAQADRAGRDTRGGSSKCRQSQGRDRPVQRHSGGGAVARAGGERGQRAQRRRDRARHRSLRELSEWRSGRNDERHGDGSSRSHHHARGPPQAAHGLWQPLQHHQRRRPDLVRPKFRRPVSPRGRLRRSHPQGREAGGPTGTGADQVRAGDQPQDRQGARPRRTANAARPCRRGDRMIRRREFITLLGGAVAWPVAARAQQAGMPMIGFLRNALPGGSGHLLSALREGLNEGGYIEGRNVLIDYRWSEDRDQLPALAADLVGRHCTVIIAGGNAKAVTATTPIVFATGDDPIHVGLVASLNQPGGNITGVYFYSGAELQAKQLGLLRELVPSAVLIGVLTNPRSPQSESQARNAQEAARALGVSTLTLHTSSQDDFDLAFATLAQQGAGALLIAGDALFTGYVDRLVALTIRQRIPAIHGLREFAAAGLLMTYGANIASAYRQVGVYTSKILKGAKPAELPVIQPTIFEFVINLKTAKTLGIEVPPTLLARADQVIE